MNQLLETTISSEDAGGKASELMEHHEAIEMMASERYLLDELTPELRDAYEEHMFGCAECANDARFGAAFVDHAKAVLPGMASAPVAERRPVKPTAEKHDWFAWLRPAIMVPAFACLLAIVGYQNLVVYPALQASAVEPRLLPPASALHGDVRSGLPVITADLVTGATINVSLQPQSGRSANFVSYKFEFYDSKSNLIWTRSMPSTDSVDDMATIWLPGHIKDDSYKLKVTGVSADGQNSPVREEFFELRVKK